MFDITSLHPGAYIDASGNFGELKDGAEILRFRPHPPGAHVNVDAQIPVYIAFRQAGKDLTAENIKVIFKWIDAYVRGFEPLFRGELAMGKGSPIKFVPAEKAP